MRWEDVLLFVLLVYGLVSWHVFILKLERRMRELDKEKRDETSMDCAGTASGAGGLQEGRVGKG